MADICGDNRFEIIKKAKAELLKSTNIETSEDEMKVLDNFLFRCWQMGWLDMYDGISEEEFAEQWSKFDINEAYKKIMEEKALKQYEVPTGSIKIWDLPNGCIFKDENGNVINATKIVLEKKKSKWPKAIWECHNILSSEERLEIEDSLAALEKLLICRDAYWKIAGEEMGLGKPWKPDYDSGVDKFGIICLDGVVQESYPTTYWERHLNKILDFPTAEMRDAFYENFKELIEQCKELL